MNTIQLDPISDPLQLPAIPGCRAVSANVGTNDDVIRMWVSAAIEDAVFDKEQVLDLWTHTQEPYSATVIISSATGTRDQTLPLVTATFPQIQTLPGGEILVVAPRCMYFEEGASESNARIFDSNGVVREFCLGDGIAHVQTDRLGRIWVAYGDEGIFGNLGWGCPGGPEPIGAAGLVCFDQMGHVTWKFQPPKDLSYIVDCDALNVTGDGVWACYGIDFPIIRIDDRGNVIAWQTDLKGPQELAVSGSSVLAFGSTFKRTTECALLWLDDGYAERVADITLRLPDSVDLQAAEVIGRGAMLYVLANDTLFRFTVPSN